MVLLLLLLVGARDMKALAASSSSTKVSSALTALGSSGSLSMSSAVTVLRRARPVGGLGGVCLIPRRRLALDPGETPDIGCDGELITMDLARGAARALKGLLERGRSGEGAGCWANEADNRLVVSECEGA